MADSDKNIVITPNKGSSTAEPKVSFVGANASGSDEITLNVSFDGVASSLSFEGSSGQLFSVTNSLSGTIFSVNDVSGIPSIEVLDDGTILLAETSGVVYINDGIAWHAGNDGAGSGLDADLLDGQQGSYYVNTGNVSTTTQTTGANSLSTTASRTYAVQFDASDNLVVNVPWTDTDTNTNDYVDSLDFNTSTGVLTLGRTGSLPDLTKDLDGRYLTSIPDAYLLNTGDTSTGMQSFYTSLTNNDDYINSPISIRERGLAGAGDGEDRDSPNLNFHWGGRISNSLWMNSAGDLTWGSYSTTGIPQTDGTFKSWNLYASGSIQFGGLSRSVAYDFDGNGSKQSADALAYLKFGSGVATGTDLSTVDTISPSWSAISGSSYANNKFRIMSARGNSSDVLLTTPVGHGDTTIIGNVIVDGTNTRLYTGIGIEGTTLNLIGENIKSNSAVTVPSLVRTNVSTFTVSATAVEGEIIYVSTSGLTVTLPANPTTGSEIHISVGNFTDTVIARNGKNIMGLAEDLTIDTANIGIKLIYLGSTPGWRIF